MGVTIICSILGSNALVLFIQFLINRHDEKKGKFKKITSNIEQIQQGLNVLKEEIEQRNALDARRHILRASDEIRQGKRHSKEYFDQLNEDIDAYNRYCEGHADFKNNKGIKAIENINRVYAKCIENNDFDD